MFTPEELADMKRYDAEIDRADKPGIHIHEIGGTQEYHRKYNRKYYLSRRSELLEKANARYKKCRYPTAIG